MEFINLLYSITVFKEESYNEKLLASLFVVAMLAGCGSTGGDGKDASATGLKGKFMYTLVIPQVVQEKLLKRCRFERN
mgnify:CR=1 FL=1